MSQLYLRGEQSQKLTIEKLDGNFIYLQDGIIESKQIDYKEETNSILDCFTESVSTTNGSLEEELLYIKTLPPNFIDNSPISIKAYFTTGSNDNNKTIRLKLSGQTIFDSSIDSNDPNPNNKKVLIDLSITRTNSTTALVTGYVSFTGSGNQPLLSTLSSLDWEGEQDFEITGQNGEEAEPKLIMSPMNGLSLLSLGYVLIQFTEMPTKKGIRGLYVNDFDTIVGNSTKENELFTFCLQRGFNHIYLYDLTSIIGSPLEDDLDNFITSAKQKGLIVGGIGGSLKRLVSLTPSDDSRLYYNNTRVSPSQRFNRLNLENEFWIYDGPPSESGQPETFATYSNWLTNINTSLQSTPYAFDVYIGNISDPGSGYTGQQIATDLVQKTKRILKDMYISTSQFNSPAWGLNYIDEKLKLIADAAAEQNKTIEIVIIFSGKQNGMASYFTQNTFLSAWQKVLQGFNSWGTTWGQSTAQNKNRLKFVGYFVYTYQDSDTNPNVTGVKDLPYIW
jgi:hypothetical protein